MKNKLNHNSSTIFGNKKIDNFYFNFGIIGFFLMGIFCLLLFFLIFPIILLLIFTIAFFIVSIFFFIMNQKFKTKN